MKQGALQKMVTIIGNSALATSIYESILAALDQPFVNLSERGSVWRVFEQSLNTAIRNIEEHPRGRLFQRLIEFGPHHPDAPYEATSDGETILSDPECEACVEFICSHMINQFKGELGEILALEPCINLIQRLKVERRLSSDIQLYWGNLVQERRRIRIDKRESSGQWGNFAQGADGLLAELIPSRSGEKRTSLQIQGIVEVKSMTRSVRRLLRQINGHISRLSGGLRLCERVYSDEEIDLLSTDLTRIMVIPSTWKLSREWYSTKSEEGRTMQFAESPPPISEDQIEELEPKLWKIRLKWSQEALNQAAYEMTFWYMSQVGRHVYHNKPLPKGWEDMTSEEAGFNAIKMMLYYFPLRMKSERHRRLAVKLYNIYCFGYPVGVDSKEMLWPEDVFDKEDGIGNNR